jgi:hypothetical protein
LVFVVGDGLSGPGGVHLRLALGLRLRGGLLLADPLGGLLDLASLDDLPLLLLRQTRHGRSRIQGHRALADGVHELLVARLQDLGGLLGGVRRDAVDGSSNLC